jgi:hypothetical protein
MIWKAWTKFPEPHEFTVTLTRGAAAASVCFEEHAHPPNTAHRGDNMRAAVVRVIPDAVSGLVIVGLLLARFSAGSGWTRWPVSSAQA